MAALKEPVKIFIVQSLACFETPQQVADAVKQDFKIEVSRQQVAAYDPTKHVGRNLSKKLKELFERTRKDFKENIEDIPIANKAFHFKELQKMYDGWGKDKVRRQNVLKQAQGLLQSGRSAGKDGEALQTTVVHATQEQVEAAVKKAQEEY